MRSPAVLGLLALLVLVALPVYLLRRPKPTKAAAFEPMPRLEASSNIAPFPEAASAVIPAATEIAASKRVAFADAKTAKCTPKGGGRVTSERCDRLAPFEDALARAIRDNMACAPPAAAPFTVSFVLSLDFDRKNMHLWAGRSGSMKKRSSSDLIRCVEHAIVLPDWETVAHQYQKYDVNLIAAYPGNAPTLPALGGTAAAPLGASPVAPLGAPTLPALGAPTSLALPGNPSLGAAANVAPATPSVPAPLGIGPAQGLGAK